MTAATVYVPRDASALSIGAGEVAAAIAKESSARGIELQTEVEIIGEDLPEHSVHTA